MKNEMEKCKNEEPIFDIAQISKCKNEKKNEKWRMKNE